MKDEEPAVAPTRDFSGGACEEVSAPITKEEAKQILFGMSSMKAAIKGKDVRGACFRGKDGVEWVDFLYGAPGDGPPAFKGGWGIAKEIAKRAFEHGLDVADPSAGKTLLALPMVIGLGKATRLRPTHPLEKDRIRLDHTVRAQLFTVILVKDNKGSNHWLLSGYEVRAARTKQAPPMNPRKFTVPPGLHPKGLHGGVPWGERGSGHQGWSHLGLGATQPFI